MNTLKDYVNWKLAHADKVAEAEGYPLVLENCKRNKRMKELKVFGYIGKNLIWGKGSMTRETCTMSCSGSEITLNGVCSSNMSFRSSPYTESQSITLKANTKYIFSIHYISGTMVSSPGGFAIGIYSQNGKWLVSASRYTSNYQNTWSKSVTVTEDTKVSLYCVGRGEFDNLIFGIQVEEGSAVTDYEPYEIKNIGEETENGYKIPIVQSGKNVFDLTKRRYSNGSTQQTFDNGLVVKGSVSSSTLPTSSGRGWLFIGQDKYDERYIKNKVDTKITISLDVTLQERLDTTVTPQTMILLNQVINSPSYTLELGVKKHISCTFTPKSEWEDLYFVICLCSQVLKIENIQVEYGSTETPYEPYIEPITYDVFIDEPLANGEMLDVKEHIQLPKITSKTTVFTVDSDVKPSNIYGKYIK